MAWFRRSASHPVTTADPGGAAETRRDRAVALAGALPTGQGPWDAADRDIEERPRLDLGALQLPAISGMQLVPVPDPADQQRIGALEIVVAASQMQISLVATKRSGGLWAGMVEEFAEALAAQDIPHEIVLDADITRMTAEPQSEQGAMPMLAEAYQGRGWLMRVIYRGAAATDEAARECLSDVVRGCVVRRGEEFLAPGDTIALSPPQNVADGTEG
ncbi:DUF3710 domain-containing protein [Nanchangia anserum]|uniref:DUF3710 domain-containing protein n=1 Tax=Nanchangia anserum TaxID=2692125 RepID=A0A8I0G6R4_9ACTO|nr:DUF3710 domain-containing protein [Nanchangia anserum]MBD3688830.1 DUF3710 domain-containing protein [Nanchangia anserum]QOX81105.1 DUF3710 domain-containing protein [Nanchangia anserum]